MRVAGKLIWPFIVALVLITLSRVFILGATPAQMVNLPDSADEYVVDDENAPEVQARVARISFLKGDAQIRRADGGDWERAAMNLPVVEGDEITTSADARLEIQFDNSLHMRLAENAYLKVVTLRDEGIAVSLSLGSMSLTITLFDKDKSFFEIDAPKTTVAVQKAGIYRIDAGQQGDADIRVSVTDDGEARVYSDNLGFTLKNNRSARVFVDGANVGEWQADDASRFSDEFDTWSLDRDGAIAQRLKDAFYDKYYDNDIYGADDLNGYGEWVHTASYGYVWRPYRNATSYYADWSPYRYGHWRWIPPFGWTWVNDEPWGWATYHHGRWLYDAGYWYWSPYGYYRPARSWWFPALVGVNIYNNNVCWYPLGYHHAYYNYNHNYHGHNGGHHNGGGHHQQPPVIYPTGGIKVPHTAVPPKIPASAVMATSMGDFGSPVKPVRNAPLATANAVIAAKLDDGDGPALPTYAAVTKKIGREIVTDRPKADVVASHTKVGAAPRKPDAPLDKDLRSVRVFNGREPVRNTVDNGGVRMSNDTRNTGAITRNPPIRQAPVNTTPPIRQTPPTPRVRTQDDSDSAPVRNTPRNDTPVRQPPVRNDPPVRQPPRTDTQPTRQPPRTDTQPTRQPPRSEPTRQPSVKSEPKQENKPTKAPDNKKAKSD